MGVSTDAILVYGIPLAEDSVPEFDEDEGRKEEGPAWISWSGNSEGDIGLVHHCSDSCTMYVLSIASTERTAWRGHPQEIKPAELVSDPLWAGKLVAYAEKWKLQLDGAPGWWLVSWWG